MPDTMYASTPSAPAVELSCPVVTDDDVRRAMQGFTSADDLARSPLLSQEWLGSSDGGVFRSRPLGGVFGSSSSGSGNDSAERFAHTASSPLFATSTGAGSTTHLVPLFPSASDAALQGFVRVINHSGDTGEVQIDAVDDTGTSYGPLTLSIHGHQTLHFNSNDLESGNAGKGLTGSTGVGEGDWRLTLSSDLDLEVLSYIRTTDGFLTAMHDLAPVADGVHRIAIFNPGSNTSQVSRLRLLNTGEEAAQVTIAGTDDRGMSPGSPVEVTVAAGASKTLTAAELESGGTGLTGALGDGAGKWRLAVTSARPIHALSLLSSPTGHLTNLSTAPSNAVDGVHEVALFPSASDASGRQGFVRVINHADETAEITITAYDETDWTYDPLTLSLPAGQVAHFNSNDLEQGNPGKGLTGSTGAGEGDWRLLLSSDTEIEVLSYIRTTDGFLTAMHDVAPVSDTHHRVAIFNPGSNTSQVSRLRLVNGGDTAAEVTVTGIDDRGLSPGDDLQLTLPAGTTRTHTAQELEAGAEGLTGALGDGAGKWRLDVTSDHPIRVLSLLSSPTGHLTNLSTALRRDPDAAREATAAEVFGTLISPIVQSKCVNCHVAGGVSGNTRLVFVTDDGADHVATNFSVLETFLGEVEDGAELILNKVQGVGHGGGIQLAAGTDEFSSMERFLGLLEGEDIGPVTITPANLFDGVKMESWRSTLRRAAIVFAGRVPTEEEYASIRGAGVAQFRAAIRSLMRGPEFHEFLIRVGNDRLLTDRQLASFTIPNDGYFVDFDNEFYRLNAVDPFGQEHYRWETRVQYGAGRAPLELIAHVVENDLDYRQVLTADHIMANPWAARVYGADTEFVDPDDASEFQPSEIVSYYRQCDGHQSEFTQGIGLRVTDPGPCATDYPHAGVLNTTVFLKRYPSTATNRNRARSRWTYYHFLGLDVEKSASRTTDPVALADANNPTTHNPACTVCHAVLDPVAGAFQNYGDEGLYRDQWGGMDSLDRFYKEDPPGRRDFEVSARVRGEQTVKVGPVSLIALGDNELGVKKVRTFEGDTKLHLGLGEVVVRASNGGVVQRYEVRDVAEEEACGGRAEEGYILWDCGEVLVLPLNVPEDGEYSVEIEAWVLEAGEKAATLQAWMPGPFYRTADTWYRDMREPGFDGHRVEGPESSLRWLAERIVADPRFAEATVMFWWPAIMGDEVTEPPEDESDVGFEGSLLASNAQAAEVQRLGRGFTRGNSGRPAYNLKDLLVELVISKWFRAERMPYGDPLRSAALRDAGAQRLLTPEELARKTVALTGFQWQREHDFGARPADEHGNALTRTWHYRLLYGGIDSDGVTQRMRDLTSVMAGVAKSHAAESSCPMVLRDFYLLPDRDRWLFGGIDRSVSPTLEFAVTEEIEAASAGETETLSAVGHLRAGAQTVTIAFLNDYADETSGADRNVWLDRLELVEEQGDVVDSQELEEFDAVNCSGPTQDHFKLACSDTLEVPIEVPNAGRYEVRIAAWAEQAGDELARVEIGVHSDTESSAGASAIRNKVADLHERLLGVEVGPYSEDVDTAYRLFVDVWERKRRLPDSSFFSPSECNFASDHKYLDGILDNAILERQSETGHTEQDWDWERVDDFLHTTVNPQDVNGVARTWVVVLAFLLMDYRYLYL